MDRSDLAFVAFAVAYNAVWFWTLARARRHLRPGVTIWTRLPLGPGIFRPEAYTTAGERWRRRLVWLVLLALPACFAWLWLAARVLPDQ